MNTTTDTCVDGSNAVHWLRQTVVGSMEGILFFAVSVLLTAAGGGAFAGAVL